MGERDTDDDLEGDDEGQADEADEPRFPNRLARGVARAMGVSTRRPRRWSIGPS